MCVHALISGWGGAVCRASWFWKQQFGPHKSYGLKGKYESLFGIFFFFSPEVQLHIPEAKDKKFDNGSHGRWSLAICSFVIPATWEPCSLAPRWYPLE